MLPLKYSMLKYESTSMNGLQTVAMMRSLGLTNMNNYVTLSWSLWSTFFKEKGSGTPIRTEIRDLHKIFRKRFRHYWIVTGRALQWFLFYQLIIGRVISSKWSDRGRVVLRIPSAGSDPPAANGPRWRFHGRAGKRRMSRGRSVRRLGLLMSQCTDHVFDPIKNKENE